MGQETVASLRAEFTGDTSDLSSKLKTAKKEIDIFAKDVQAALGLNNGVNLQGSSLNDTINNMGKSAESTGASFGKFAFNMIAINQALALAGKAVRAVGNSFEYLSEGAQITSLRNSSVRLENIS